MATEIEIQNFKKFLRNEFDQTEQMENDFDELVEILNKIQPAGLEIVAFCQSKDIPIELFKYVGHGINTFEEGMLFLDPGICTSLRVANFFCPLE